MAWQEKLLFQSRPAGTTAATAYSLPASTTTIIKTIVVVNTSGAAATFRLFMHNTGSTYDETTAIAWDVSLSAGAVQQFDGFYVLNGTGATFGVRTNTANALTFSGFGPEIS